MSRSGRTPTHPSNQPSAPDHAVILEALHQSNEVMQEILTAVLAYRNKCESEGGFSESAAEAMAVQYHGMILQASLGQAK